MKSVMTHQFKQVPHVGMERSVFDLSRGYKTTFDSGYLIPFFRQMVVPGDEYTVNVSGFARLSTPIHAPMDNMYLTTFFFFVPWRLIWDNFQKFMGEQEPATYTAYNIPQMVLNNESVGSLHDYLALPTGIAQNVSVNSFYHRCYNAIYNAWFRDENLQASVTVDKGDGPDTKANYVLLRRGKRHDYFTSCLPFTQKSVGAGSLVDVTLPLGTAATVRTTASNLVGGAQVGMKMRQTTAGSNSGVAHMLAVDSASPAEVYETSTAGGAGSPGMYPSNLYADLSTATAATINSLRTAFQLQRYYERMARGGSRYTEIIRSHFQVISPDARLQRPEYLGGGTTDVNIHPVPQTSNTSAGNTAQGNVSAFATINFGGHGFRKSFTEHGFILGLMCVDADLNYQQGLDREFSYRTATDLYWPSFSHLGEQAVLNKEIYCQGTADDALTFGYQERYAEMRYGISHITGKFRSTYSTPLDSYHLAQKFTALPTLGATFIVSNPPVDRIVAVNTEPQFYFDSFASVKAARPMPTYSVPGMIDHF